MASMFKRINDVITANLNDLIDKVEDPERMVKQIIREMEDNISHAKESVIDAIASEKQLGKELENHQQQSAGWLKRAETAMAGGNEALARQALASKHEHDNIAESLEASWTSAKNTSMHLKTQLGRLEAKLEEAKLKKGSLVARQRANQARHHMDKTLANARVGLELDESFGRMEDSVQSMENRLAAAEDLNHNYSEAEREFMKMEVNTAVEEELANLKAKLNKE